MDCKPECVTSADVDRTKEASSAFLKLNDIDSVLDCASANSVTMYFLKLYLSRTLLFCVSKDLVLGGI